MREVRVRYPQMRVVVGGRHLIIWEGELAGFSRTYTVRIVWPRFAPDPSLRLKYDTPRVFVLGDVLEPRSPEEPVPHRYSGGVVGQWICCWDPKTDDWRWNQAIAHTIIPYAEQWLASYEMWRLTGRWLAPGRHLLPEATCENSAHSTETSSRDQRERGSAAAIAKIGRLIGTSVSSALMAVASEEFYRWPRSRDWRGINFKGARLPVALIWLPAPRPAASSPLDLLAA